MKSSFGFAETLASADTRDSASTDLDDLWLFTDPTARAIYSQQGRLDFTTKFYLFREALPQLKELGEKDLANLHETLYYYSVHKV